MTLASQIQSDNAAVFLNTDDFAQSVTRYPLAVTADAVAVTAVWEPDEPSVTGMGSAQNRERGLDNDRKGTLRIAETVGADTRDTWLIASQLWSTLSVQTVDGMQYCRLQRWENELRTTTGLQRIL